MRNPTALLLLGPFLAFFGTGYFSGFGTISAELFPTRIRVTAQGLMYNIGRIASAAASVRRRGACKDLWARDGVQCDGRGVSLLRRASGLSTGDPREGARVVTSANIELGPGRRLASFRLATTFNDGRIPGGRARAHT